MSDRHPGHARGGIHQATPANASSMACGKARASMIAQQCGWGA